MTRVNLIDVEELSDQNLIAEYRELPRCIKQDINTADAPDRYVLGFGHMKWAKYHSMFLLDRYYEICEEMKYRGFTVNYPYFELYKYHKEHTVIRNNNHYMVDWEDELLSRNRIIERYKSNPKVHTWTKREKPIYLQIL